MALTRRRHPAQLSEPAPQPSHAAVAAPALSWPEAFLATTVVVASFGYHYLLISHGTDPATAVRYVLMIAAPLVALILPGSVLGSGARSVCRAAAAVLTHLGGGGSQ